MRVSGLIFLFFLLLFAFSRPSFADDSGQPALDSNMLGGNALDGVAGTVHANLAAGEVNLQSNTAVISNAPLSNRITVTQKSAAAAGSASASVRIGPGVSTGSIGVIQVNQAAGNGNEQANAAFIGLDSSTPAAAEITLRQSVAPTTVPASSTQTTRQAKISTTAFSGSQGVLQVNQAAGTSNATANSFALRLGPGM